MKQAIKRLTSGKPRIETLPKVGAPKSHRNTGLAKYIVNSAYANNDTTIPNTRSSTKRLKNVMP